jgi:bacteriocin-like protein
MAVEKIAGRQRVGNKTDQELTEKELAQVTGGDKKIDKGQCYLYAICSGRQTL